MGHTHIKISQGPFSKKVDWNFEFNQGFGKHASTCGIPSSFRDQFDLMPYSFASPIWWVFGSG